MKFHNQSSELLQFSLPLHDSRGDLFIFLFLATSFPAFFNKMFVMYSDNKQTKIFSLTKFYLIFNYPISGNVGLTQSQSWREDGSC